jgi:hypothetical protein
MTTVFTYSKFTNETGNKQNNNKQPSKEAVHITATHTVGHTYISWVLGTNSTVLTTEK